MLLPPEPDDAHGPCGVFARARWYGACQCEQRHRVSDWTLSGFDISVGTDIHLGDQLIFFARLSNANDGPDRFSSSLMRQQSRCRLLAQACQGWWREYWLCLVLVRTGATVSHSAESVAA